MDMMVLMSWQVKRSLRSQGSRGRQAGRGRAPAAGSVGGSVRALGAGRESRQHACSPGNPTETSWLHIPMMIVSPNYFFFPFIICFPNCQQPLVSTPKPYLVTLESVTFSGPSKCLLLVLGYFSLAQLLRSCGELKAFVFITCYVAFFFFNQ